MPEVDQAVYRNKSVLIIDLETSVTSPDAELCVK